MIKHHINIFKDGKKKKKIEQYQRTAEKKVYCRIHTANDNSEFESNLKMMGVQPQ